MDFSKEIRCKCLHFPMGLLYLYQYFPTVYCAYILIFCRTVSLVLVFSCGDGAPVSSLVLLLHHICVLLPTELYRLRLRLPQRLRQIFMHSSDIMQSLCQLLHVGAELPDNTVIPSHTSILSAVTCRSVLYMFELTRGDICIHHMCTIILTSSNLFPIEMYCMCLYLPMILLCLCQYFSSEMWPL